MIVLTVSVFAQLLNLFYFIFLSHFSIPGFLFVIVSVLLCSGAVRRHPLHSSKPGRVLEVRGDHDRPEGGLSLQPRFHGLSWSSHQHPDLGAGGWRRHVHAVSAQLRVVRPEPVLYLLWINKKNNKKKTFSVCLCCCSPSKTFGTESLKFAVLSRRKGLCRRTVGTCACLDFS